jgi:hypothetical protein
MLLWLKVLWNSTRAGWVLIHMLLILKMLLPFSFIFSMNFFFVFVFFFCNLIWRIIEGVAFTFAEEIRKT